MRRPSPDDLLRADARSLWHGLGGLYREAAGDGRRAALLGFAVLGVVAALVLISAPLLGTGRWVGPTAAPVAAAVPVFAGLVCGGGYLVWRRWRFSREKARLEWALEASGEDARSPTAGGLGAYHDAQLLLLRSEYEYVVEKWGGRARGSGRLFEGSFGFYREDGFESGPLNVAPETPEMRRLRGLWEARLKARRSFGDGSPPGVGLREERAHGVFPKGLGERGEARTRGAYLALSRELLRRRYGRGPIPEPVRERAERDLREYEALGGEGGR